MTLDRRSVLGAAVVAGAAAAALSAGPRPAAAKTGAAMGASAIDLGIEPGLDTDQADAMAAAIERLAATGTPLLLPPGRYAVSSLALRPGARLVGVPGATVIEFVGDERFIFADGGAGIAIEGITFDGQSRPLDPGRADGLLTLNDCDGLSLRDVTVRGGLLNGVSLRRCSGRVTHCLIEACGATAVFSFDAKGLEIAHNDVRRIGNNGVQVWTDKPGEDGTLVVGNRISMVEARAGGTGENGNGISIFRAGSVVVSGNRITDCAFSAIRSNAGSNCQMIGNSCERLGEVALYAEFGFEGVIIASNLVDTAAQGISVTNFNEGGRLAVVQGNLIRNLFMRKESEDTRGYGIAVEADAAVTGNVVENAPAAGILVGWGRYKRDVAVTGNVVRESHVGIGISSEFDGGIVFAAHNFISGARDGGIRAMDHGAPIGPDLSRTSSEAYPNIAVQANVSIK